MKKLIFLLFIVVSLSGFAQMQDTSLNLRLTNIENSINDFHKQYQNGSNTIFAGFGLSAIGGTLVLYSRGDDGAFDSSLAKVGTGFIAAGGLAAVVGTIICLDAHKHLQISPTGVTLTIPLNK